MKLFSNRSRERMEAALKESEERHRTFMNATSDMAFLKDERFRYVLVNRALADFFGRDPADIIGKTDFDLMAAPAAENCRRTDRKAFGSESVVVDDEPIADRIYESTKFRVPSRTGRMMIGGFIRDITDRRRAQEELKASQAQLSNALELARLGPWEYDVARDLFIFNDQFYKMFRTTAREVGGYTMRPADYARRFVHPDDVQAVAGETRKAVETDDPHYHRQIEHRMIYADGEVGHISVRIFIVKDSRGQTIRTYGVNQDITDRVRAEKELRESEERYRSVFDHSTEAILLTKPDGAILDANPAACRMFGFSRGDLLKAGRARLADATDPRLKEGLERRARDGFATGEITMLRADGTKFPVEISSTIFFDANGEAMSSMIIRDISDRLRAEEALKKRDLLFRKLSVHVPGMIYQFMRRPDGTYCLPFTTEAIRDIFGCRPEDVREDFSPIARVVVPEDLDKLVGSIEASARTMTVWQCEYRVQVPGRPVRWMFGQSTPEKLEDGSIVWHGFNTDITDRMRMEEAVRESEDKYRSIFENAQEGLFQMTPDGRYLTANQGLANLLGFESPEDLAASVEDIGDRFFAEPEEFRRLLRKVEADGRVTGFEARLIRRDGRAIWASMNQRVVRDRDGRVLFHEGFVEDISSRKESLEQIRKALEATVQAISVIVETRDPYTAGHQRRVAELACAIAVEMELAPERIDGLRLGGLIHDLGKISVPAEILSRPSRLTDVEFSLIKTHARSGYDILKDIDFPWPVARMVLEHHEREDGSGYPTGLAGTQMLQESRILAVADVVESMASHRPYRPALGIAAALDEITRNREILYDREAVDACLNVFRKGYVLPE